MSIRLAFLISGLSTGGAEMMLYKLVTRMDRDKFEMRVVSLTGSGPVGERIRDAGIPVESLGMARGIPDPRMIFRFARWLKERNPDIIQTWMYHADLVGGVSARMSGGIPVVWNIRHSNLDHEDSKQSTLWTARACAVLSRWLPSKIVCCSHASKEVHRAMGYDENRMVVIPNGFDLDAFSPMQDAGTKMRRSLGLTRAAVLVGLAARFDPQKDHRTFFHAAGVLHREYPEVHFVLCGDDITWDNPRITSWIDGAAVRSVTHLLGRLDDMPSFQAALDVAVSSSSHGEGFPNVVGEAMACCTPCVVTDVGDSARIVGHTGIVVPPGNAAALIAALKRMVVLGDGRRELGLLARKRISEEYSLEKTVERYEEMYGTILPC